MEFRSENDPAAERNFFKFRKDKSDTSRHITRTAPQPLQPDQESLGNETILPVYKDPPDLESSEAYNNTRNYIRQHNHWRESTNHSTLLASEDRDEHRGLVDETTSLLSEMVGKENHYPGELVGGDHFGHLFFYNMLAITGRYRNKVDNFQNPYREEDTIRLMRGVLGIPIPGNPYSGGSADLRDLQELERDITIDVLSGDDEEAKTEIINTFKENGDRKEIKLLAFKILQNVGRAGEIEADQDINKLTEAVFSEDSYFQSIQEFLRTLSDDDLNKAVESFIDEEIEEFDRTRGGERVFQSSTQAALEALYLLDVYAPDKEGVLSFLRRISQSEIAPFTLTDVATGIYNRQLHPREELLEPKGVLSPTQQEWKKYAEERKSKNS